MITLEQAKQMIAERGGTPLDGASWEDETHVYASSVETWGPSTYLHPKFEVEFHKPTKWLVINTPSGAERKQLS